MAKVTGIGGVFFQCKDQAATKEWYTRVLGLIPNDYGGFDFLATDINQAFPKADARTIFAPFEQGGEYFKPSTLPFMINMVVDDLDGMLAQIEAAGESLVGDVLDESYGRFAWIMDPNGIKIELYQPKSSA